VDENKMIKTNTDFLVTETTLDPKIPVDKVVSVLRERRTTGQLTFHLSQGGIQKVALTEKTKTERVRDKIRGLLGMSE